MPNRSGNQRRNPRQARSRATYDVILEAAAQILERRGPAGLNTNDIAARAGVSIGSVYQYFPDKQAILVAAARRELGLNEGRLPGRQTAVIEALIRMVETLGKLGAGRGAQTALARAAGARITARKPHPDTARERRRLDVFDFLRNWLNSPVEPILARAARS